MARRLNFGTVIIVPCERDTLQQPIEKLSGTDRLNVASGYVHTAFRRHGKFVRLAVLFTRNYLNRKITRSKIKTPSGLKFRVNRARILNGPV